MSQTDAAQSRLFIASADGHVGIPTERYRDYLERRYHDDLDGFLRVHKYRWTPDRPESVLAPTVFDHFKTSERYRTGGMDSLFDPTRRLKELDEDGVAVEVLFADDQNLNTPPWLAGLAPAGLDREYPPELRLIGARAYNRWLAEFCSAAPDRLLGAITLATLHDVEGAVAEVRRAYASGLQKVVMLPLEYYLPLYHHPRYEPFWQVCAELDLTVAVHLADGGPNWYSDNQWGVAIQVLESWLFYSKRPLWSLIFGGVLERYPKLRLVFTEQGADWVPQLVGFMDVLATGSKLKAITEEPLPRLPSEYFRRQCFVANSVMDRREIDMRQFIGTDVMIWGSDFPHQEGMWPTTKEHMKTLFSGVSDAEARAILGENFCRAYKVGAEAFKPLVDRIGLTPSALGIAV